MYAGHGEVVNPNACHHTVRGSWPNLRVHVLTLTALYHFCIHYEDQRVYSILNLHKCLS